MFLTDLIFFFFVASLFCRNICQEGDDGDQNHFHVLRDPGHQHGLRLRQPRFPDLPRREDIRGDHGADVRLHPGQHLTAARQP